MVIIVMGVSGAGKSTVGKRLAEQLGWHFVEADDYHPPANVAKMSRGEPLTDDDREPWLAALQGWVQEACARGEQAVLACSALTDEHRRLLAGDDEGCVRYVHLDVPADVLRGRLEARGGHFAGPDLLDSQLDTLEPPAGALRVDGTPAPDAVAAAVRRELGL